MAISLWWQERSKKARRLVRRAVRERHAQTEPPGDSRPAREATATPSEAGEPWHAQAARRAALSLRLVDPTTAHVFIKDQEACREGCGQECTFLCPAGVFAPATDASGRPFISVRYELCVECAACRIFCARDNIEMDYPVGGYGIVHRYG